MVTSGKLAKGPRPPSLCPHGAHRPWLKIVQFLCSAALPRPAARCSDPMPMSEKSVVLGQGRGQREPQLQRGEGGRGPALDLLALPPLPQGSPGWTTWWG